MNTVLNTTLNICSTGSGNDTVKGAKGTRARLVWCALGEYKMVQRQQQQQHTRPAAG